MFAGASATIYRNEDGEPVGWSYEDTYAGDHDPAKEYNDSTEFGWLVCADHAGWAKSCPRSCWGDNLIHADELCCGPEGCCSRCCGTDEDMYKGSWHDGCDIQTRDDE